MENNNFAGLGKIDKKLLLEKLSELGEDDIKTAVSEIAAALGANEKQAKRAADNTGKIKKKLYAMSDEEIQKLIAEVGAEKAEEILRQFY